MGKGEEKVTMSETLPWVGRPHFSRCIYHRMVDDRAAPPLLNFINKSRTTPLGLLFTPHVSQDPAKMTKKPKARSLESSPVKKCTHADHDHPTHTSLSRSGITDSTRPKTPLTKQRSAAATETDFRRQSHKTEFSEFTPEPLWSKYLETGPHAMELADNWIVDMSQLFLGHKFATGNYSRLYHGIYKDQEVAVKVIRQPEDAEDKAATLDRQFVQEVSCLSCLHHPNIVQFVAACRKRPVYCIVMEYVPGGSLRSFLEKNNPGSIPLKTVVMMALDVARGMTYLHSQGVVHRDLKSDNLVLTKELHVKLADFGVGCQESQCDLFNADLGTYRWMAPEMIKHKHYSKKVDVYSFGIVLSELVTGLVPFHDMTPVQAAFAVVNKNARPVLPDHCPVVLRRLMQHCWSANPEKRPDFNEIVNTLEQFEAHLNDNGMKFSTWHGPHEHASKFLRCFQGFSTESPYE
jgi:tRNA A-37 threonylcarbamoyl transferase component Bud32